jgi:hypothetical protein
LTIDPALRVQSTLRKPEVISTTPFEALRAALQRLKSGKPQLPAVHPALAQRVEAARKLARAHNEALNSRLSAA